MLTIFYTLILQLVSNSTLMQFSNNFRFRWTQTSSEVNYMNFVEGKHLVNHISNSSKILTNKLSTIEVINELKNNMYIG